VKKVVTPPRTSRPTVLRRALMEKYRSRPLRGLILGPSLRRDRGDPAATSAGGLPVRPAGRAPPAADRKRVVVGKRVDLGGRRIIYKKMQQLHY